MNALWISLSVIVGFFVGAFFFSRKVLDLQTQVSAKCGECPDSKKVSMLEIENQALSERVDNLTKQNKWIYNELRLKGFDK